MTPALHITNPRILLVDDSSDDRVLVRRQLQRAFEEPSFAEVDSLEALEQALGGRGFDAAISDYHLGWGNGLAVLQRVRSTWPDTASIICTGTGTELVAVQAMKGGVDDYVVKSSKDLRRLPLAVKRAIERKRQEHALLSAEEELRDLLERLPAGIYRTTLDGELLYGNPAFAALFLQTDSSPLIGSSLGRHYVDPEDRTRWIARLEVEGESVGEFQTRHPDGGTRWIRNRGRLVRGRSGEPRFIEGVVDDITKRKVAERETERRGRYLSLLQAATSVANEQEDFAGAIAEAMRAICHQIDWPVAHLFLPSDEGTIEPSELWIHRGEGPTDELRSALAAVPHEADGGLVGRVYASGRPEWRDDLQPGPPAQSRHARSTTFSAAIGVPILVGTEVAAVIQLLHTEPRPHDNGLLEALYQAGIQLGRVAEREEAARIREKIEEKARRAQKMEAVGRLAGGVAHDFNNLITVLLMESRSAQGIAGLPEPARQAFRSIFETSERAALLTRQLLSFSKGGPGEAQPVEASDVVRELQPMLQRVIGERHALEAALTDEATTVRIDRVQLEQVIMNLIVNARDAMPAGGTIAVSVARRPSSTYLLEGESDCVVVNVSDSGHGIPESMREAIFEPFFSTKAEGGTGLGLSICYGIVTGAKGDLRVYSEEGVGTTFSVVLPALDAPAHHPTPETGEDSSPPTGSETILVVEDQETVRRVTVRALEAQGYVTVEAQNAEQALDVLARGDPRVELVLSDVVLPGMGGPELMQEVKRKYPGVRVVLASGYGEDLVRSQLEADARSTVIIQKPFSITDLARKVRGVLDAEAPVGGENDG